MQKPIEEQARELVGFIARENFKSQGFGSLSPSVYDNAWISMVKKDIDGEMQYLFPEAVEFVKNSQLPDGSWPSNGSDLDGIMHMLAALLAMTVRVPSDAQLELTREELDLVCRCAKAKIALQKMFGHWDIQSADRVGFEILIPNLLRLLEERGTQFEFPAKEELFRLGDAKLRKLRPILESPVQTTLIHSLEAFVGTFDFDKVKHHQMPGGSMFGSPSSTAAFLMNSSVWNQKAEDYLRDVSRVQSPNQLVMGILLESGFTAQYFGEHDLEVIKKVLQTTLESQKGLTGFAPGCLPDADDTAKANAILIMLGEDPPLNQMLKEFEGEFCFLTYHRERNASITANCNILMCLLRSDNWVAYSKQIVKCATYISRSWFSGNMNDKWNVSVQYPRMLMAQALNLLLARLNEDMRGDISESHQLRQDIPAILNQIFAQTPVSQKQDGSWDSKPEVTAYAVLTLSPLVELPFNWLLREEGRAKIESGKAYLLSSQGCWTSGEYLWIEKVAFASSTLSKAYCIAALKGQGHSLPAITTKTSSDEKKALSKLKSLFGTLPLFSDMASFELDSCLLESQTYRSMLQEKSNMIFPPNEKTDDGKYMNYIPFTWIGCKNLRSTDVSGDTISDMIIISMLNFQVDAYMETVLERQYQGRLEELKQLSTISAHLFPR
ncbi:Phyllocladan-16-alpha-ol synthase [Lachnellula occidentalis]|uniref:Phyllocladan-16-alpha-ol synthase n=1 Tax=Lachnellula occidentalis TaxID=215460 RepID=A0A8H8UK17_9HELO|nr:Phyllocladan-16-alpha-ol synthase [Lachnellula occidentalis]